MGRKRRSSVGFFNILVSFVLLCHQVGAAAQVSSMALGKLETCSFRARLTETESRVPIPFASAYLTHRNDSTILSFCFSDDDGNITLPTVAAGEYTLYIEMLGYDPYAQYVSSRGTKSGIKDLGEITLSLQKERLTAAVVTGSSRDMTVIKDTVILNATLFQQSGNDKLVDILRKMPGMEVTNNGISFNGKPIDNVTIGGHTFFLNDPSMALNNLPAKIVQNLRVYPEAKRQIMDVVLKQEYLNSVIGSATLSAGYDLEPGSNSSILGSYFGDKANYAALASIQTMNDPLNSTIHTVFGGREGSVIAQRSGIEKEIVVGAEVAGVLTLKYDDSRKSVLDSISQQTYFNGMVSNHDEILSGETRQRQASASLALSRNTTSGFRLNFNGRVNVGRDNESSFSSVNAANGFVADAISANVSASAFKSLKKPGGNLQFILVASLSSSNTDGCDQTINWSKTSRSYGFRGVCSYRYPIGDHLAISSKLVGSFNPTRTVRASDSDYYTFSYDNYIAEVTEFLGLDCNLKNGNVLNIGVNGIQTHSSIWNSYVSPVLSYSYKAQGKSISVEYKGQSSNPGRQYLAKSLDISNPTYGIIGNESLESSFLHSLSSSLNFSWKRASVNARASYDITSNPLVNAVWYNNAGRRFIHPVNSSSPIKVFNSSLSFNAKFGPRNCFRLRVSPSFRRSSSTGLLAKGTSDIADPESFDFDDFYSWFDGSDSFRQTSNEVSVASANASLSWTRGSWFSSLSTMLRYKSYSFDSGFLSNSELLDYKLTNETGYTFPSALELRAVVEYSAYKGYTSSLARPSAIVNLSISYPFKKISVFVHALDILDQRNVFTNAIDQSYMSDTSSLVQGRTVLAGISFNFGANASGRMGQVQRAMMGILND